MVISAIENKDSQHHRIIVVSSIVRTRGQARKLVDNSRRVDLGGMQTYGCYSIPFAPAVRVGSNRADWAVSLHQVVAAEF